MVSRFRSRISRAVERAENLKLEREFYEQQMEIETLVRAVHDALACPSDRWREILADALEKVGRIDV